MTREVKIGDRVVGDGQKAYIVAEIGINHNGDLAVAKRMIDAAVHAGADAVSRSVGVSRLGCPAAAARGGASAAVKVRAVSMRGCQPPRCANASRSAGSRPA